MARKHIIKPETINILGGSQKKSAQRWEDQSPAEDNYTLWNQIKSGVKRTIGLVKQAVNYIKDKIVPIAIAAAGLLNAWANFRRCTGNMGCAV